MREDKESPLGDGDAEILATALTLSAELKPLCLITMDRDMLQRRGRHQGQDRH